METIQDSIKAHMDAEGVDTINGTDWKVTYKAVTSSRLDANALKKALPDLAQQFTKTTTAAGSVSHDEDHHSHRRSCAAHRCIMALIEALEKPSAPPPTKARHREP